MTATQLANASGVSKQVLGLWLANGKPRKMDQVKTVAEVLGTTIDHLCYGKGLENSIGQNHDISQLIIGDDWVSGSFEIKIRRLKK